VSKRLLTLTVNERVQQLAAGDNALLLDVLRDGLGLTGTKQGCDGGECGACTVLVDDQPQLACITLAASCEGKRVETIEHLSQNGRMSRLQRAFHEKLGTQCGFCTPGMIMAAEALLRRTPDPSAALVSIERMRPCAMSLRLNARCCIPASFTSSTYVARP